MSDIPISLIPKMLGHEQAEQQFLHFYNSNRLHHAFLISGQSGIGKCGFAIRMARFLLSGGKLDNPDMFGGDSLDFNLDNSLVKQISNNAHPDFAFLYLGMPALKAPYEPMKVIGVEYIRKANDLIQHTIASASCRVIVIDQADTMNKSAQNALLKTLEEPNPNTYIIMCSSKPNSLLPTIRSRCCSFNLKPISGEEIKLHLQQQCTQLNESEIDAYVKLSNGSIGNALELSNNQALNIYNLMIEAFKNGGESVYNLVSVLTLKKNQHNFAMFKILLSDFLHRCLRAFANGNKLNKVIDGEEEAFKIIVNKNNAPKIIDWINSTKQSLEQTGAPVYLDLKSVILTIFLPLHESK